MSSTCEAQLRSDHAGPGARVAVVVSGWPRLSETFALNELRALHRAGMLVGVFATKPGEPGLRHAAAVELEPVVTVLRAGTADEPGRGARDPPGRERAVGRARVLRPPPHRGRRRGGEAARRPVRLQRPCPRRPEGRAGGAGGPGRAGRRGCVACNADVAATVAAAGVRPRLIPHGVDLDAFRATPAPRSARVELLAVGRFVEKKGFDVLLEAVARIERDIQLRLVGDGPLRARSSRRAVGCGLAGTGERSSRRAHDALPDCYAARRHRRGAVGRRRGRGPGRAAQRRPRGDGQRPPGRRQRRRRDRDGRA